MSGSRLAPAKVNLFLHVGAVDAAGYHPVVSLMSFADVGDLISISRASRFAFKLQGLFADALSGADPSGNLVVRAALKLFARAHVTPPPVQLTLTKTLPVASGLGGGSSDAGAALRLIRDELKLDLEDAELQDIASELGADGPACFLAAPTLAEGRGERLSPSPRLPVLPAVLVNPGVACPTGDVYQRLDDLGGDPRADKPELADQYDTVEAAVARLAGCRNDLEEPAAVVAPQIETVLSFLRSDPETALARLSGSGATAFAICTDDLAARRLASRVSKLRPSWWVRACRLGGPWPADTGGVTKP